MSNIIAMVPGSYDPITNGHINLIQRSSKLFSKIFVVVADNKSKNCLFTTEERLSLLKETLKDLKNVEVVCYNGLMVDFAKENNVSLMIRGVRALVDFGYEFELAMTNKQLNSDLEIMFMPTDPSYFVLRSSAIKNLALFDADISKMVPVAVAKKLKEKLLCNKDTN